MSLYRKASLGLAITISLATLSSSAMAQNTDIITFGKTGTSLATYTKATKQLVISGLGGAIDVTSPIGSGFYTGPGFLDITLDIIAGSGTGTASLWQVMVAGGSFKFGTSMGGNDLLEGTFTGGLMSRFGGNVLFGTDPANAVSYTGGSQIGGWLFNNPSLGGAPLVGNLNLSLSSLTPLPTLDTSGSNAGNLHQNWTGQYSGNADAIGTTVPEPGEWAAMGILATGLTGLMVKARRRRA